MDIFLVVLTYFAFIFIILVTTVKVVKIARMPMHLRWELAPIPYEKEKKKNNSSYHEEWKEKRRKSLAAIVVYMAKEIFLQKGVWENNRSLWPFSFSMHKGIYLVILSVLFHVLNALLIITSTPASILDIFQGITAVLALAGYIMGGFGAIGLILKRSIDVGLRKFGTLAIYFRLAFLAAAFISGIFAWFYTADFAAATSQFTHNVLTADTGITITMSLEVHIVISLLFLIYLPLTDMVHFITKYFLYHAVRWDDEPLNKKMEIELDALKTQTANWSADHVKKSNRLSQ